MSLTWSEIAHSTQEYLFENTDEIIKVFRPYKKQAICSFDAHLTFEEFSNYFGAELAQKGYITYQFRFHLQVMINTLKTTLILKVRQFAFMRS